MQKLRLLVTEKCNRSCRGCCNKEWDLKGLPVCTDFSEYEEIMLTGGEPLLFPEKLINIMRQIHRSVPAKVYVYTAYSKDAYTTLKTITYADGITLALHDNPDVESFERVDKFLHRVGGNTDIIKKSLRLNVFEGVDLPEVRYKGWKIKYGMKWVENCPLPEGEAFMRLPKLFEE